MSMTPRELALVSTQLMRALRELLESADRSGSEDRPYYDGLCDQVRAHQHQVLRGVAPGPVTLPWPVHPHVRVLTGVLRDPFPLVGLPASPVADLLVLDRHLRQRIDAAQHAYDLEEQGLELIAARYRREGVTAPDIRRHSLWMRKQVAAQEMRSHADTCIGQYEVFASACGRLAREFHALMEDTRAEHRSRIADSLTQWQHDIAQWYATHPGQSLPDDLYARPGVPQGGPDVHATWQMFLMLHTPVD